MNCGLEFRVVTPADHRDIHTVSKTAVVTIAADPKVNFTDILEM